jgi:hypothetical protein
MPKLELQLERTSYSPGETVRAWVRALEGGNSRAGMALLRYVERTDDYTEIPWHKMERLWDGDLEHQARYEFAIPLPSDAHPGYRSEHGSLAWEVYVRSDEFGRDTTIAQEFELVPPEVGYPPRSADAAATSKAAAWAKPLYYAAPALGAGAGYAIARVPGAVGVGALAAGWQFFEWRRRAKHFEVEAPRPVRRGERARVAVKMIDASEVAGDLGGEIECIERYDYRSTSRHGSHRETDEETLHAERVEFGPAGRSVEIEVPATMPFTHMGKCLSYVWKVIVREKRDNAMDRVAEQPLLVLP